MAKPRPKGQNGDEVTKCNERLMTKLQAHVNILVEVK